MKKISSVVVAVFAVAVFAGCQTIPAELVPFIAPQAPCDLCDDRNEGGGEDEGPGGFDAPQAPGPVERP